MKDFKRFIAEAKARGLRGHHRTRHQSHLRPARLVQARPPQRSEIERAQLVCLERHRPEVPGHADHLHRHREVELDLGPEAGQFYWHRFFSHQPDLNFDNPRVVSALVQVMKRWLDTGVDGFRLDAIPYLCERDGTNNENLPETHAIIRKLRGELDAYAKGKVLLARPTNGRGCAGIFRPRRRMPHGLSFSR
jgi:maltose alpha-D-glucosyltransferase/alpha-amylase